MCKCETSEPKAAVAHPDPCHECNFPINAHEPFFIDNVMVRGKQIHYYHADCVETRLKPFGVSLPSKEETRGSSCLSCKSDLVVGKCLCGDDVCVNCASWCIDCKAILCPEECLVVCVDCGESFCHSCAEAAECRTNGCHNHVCKYCQKTTYMTIQQKYGNKPGDLCRDCFCTPEKLEETRKKREAVKNEVLKNSTVNNSNIVHTPLKKSNLEATKKLETNVQRENFRDSATQEYEVEKIVSSKTNVYGNTLFEVKWKGFSKEFNTWEPRAGVEHLALYQNYQKQMRGKKRPFKIRFDAVQHKRQCLSKVGAQ